MGLRDGDEVALLLDGGVDERGRRVARLEELGLERQPRLLGDLLRTFEELLAAIELGLEHGIERQVPANLDDVDADDMGPSVLGDRGDETDDIWVGARASERHEDALWLHECAESSAALGRRRLSSATGHR